MSESNSFRKLFCKALRSKWRGVRRDNYPDDTIDDRKNQTERALRLSFRELTDAEMARCVDDASALALVTELGLIEFKTGKPPLYDCP